MARVAFPLVLQSPSTGSAIVGATATINQHVVGASLGSGPPATIFTSETGGGTTVTNQIVTDSTGRWTQGSGSGFAQYWLAEGTYDIVVSGTGLTSYTITRELASGGTPQPVTALPSGPYDGQQVAFVADATNGVVWHLRYRAASSSTYKWEFIGGAALLAEVDSNFNVYDTGSSGTSGPALTLPTLPNGGDFDVAMGIFLSWNNVAAAGAVSFEAGYQLGSGSTVFSLNSGGQAGGVNSLGVESEILNLYATRRQTGLSSGEVLTAKYATSGVASPGVLVANRYLRVTPIRVG